MFDKLFNKLGIAKTGPKPLIPVAPPVNTGACEKPLESPPPILDPSAQAILRAIDEKRKDDPMIGAKIGSKEIFQRLMHGMKDSKGIHVESLLCAAGSLAGYACQADLRAQAIARSMPENAAFQVIETKDGKKYFFGDPLNNALAGSKYSLWSLAAGAAEHAGCKSPVDLNEIFSHVSIVMGSPEFGVLRMPDNHPTSDTPLNYVKTIWPALMPTVKMFCQSSVEWPLLYALAVQEAIEMSKQAIDPCLALKIVMESAIPMSKIDLDGA